MKTSRILLAGLAVGLVGLGLAGCTKPEETKTKAPAAAEKKTEDTKPAPAPADQKPKDHPAH